MEWKNRYSRDVLLGVALLLCLAGCAPSEQAQSPSTTASQEETTESTFTQATLPDNTLQAGAEDTQATEPQQTSPTKPAETKPKPSTPEQTEPPEPVETIPAKEVIEGVIAQIPGKLPDVEYVSGWDKGTQVRLRIPTKQTEQAMINKLIADMQELFSMQDEQCTCGLSYQGYDPEEKAHIFIVTYSIDIEMSETATFDSAQVITRVTEAVLNSDRVDVKVFDGKNYKECIQIKEIPGFYSTEDAIQGLKDSVVTKIYTKNVLGAGYREFCIVYDSKQETHHVFLLYLR